MVSLKYTAVTSDDSENYDKITLSTLSICSVYVMKCKVLSAPISMLISVPLMYVPSFS